MRISYRRLIPGFFLLFGALSVAPETALAQRVQPRAVRQQVSFSADARDLIRHYYTTHAGVDVQALPPGIQKRLARGKPLPPGIAKQAPQAIRGIAPRGYTVMQAGLDVFLVEAATGIIHDVLMDVVR